MAQIAIRNSLHTGVNITQSDASWAAASAGGDTFENDGQSLLLVYNGGGSAITVTVAAQRSGPYDDLVVNEGGSVPAGAYMIFGPFDPARFNSAATGEVSITYSGVTSVKVQVVKLCDGLSGRPR